MHIHNPKVTLPLLVPVVFNMVHPTYTGKIIACVAMLALAAVKWDAVKHFRNFIREWIEVMLS
jgi:hypothetical protein